jgi:hypothetical protein
MTSVDYLKNAIQMVSISAHFLQNVNIEFEEKTYPVSKQHVSARISLAVINSILTAYK